jgi:arsenate reductase
MSSIKTPALFPVLNSTVEQLTSQFDQISAERKELLKQLTQFVQNKTKAGQNVYLNFICTHNSRRSHLSQLWAQAAAHLYGIPNVFCFSGGTEATAFNPRAVKAMMDTGFSIKMTKEGDNPVYEVSYADDVTPVIAFSKKYDDPFNHNKDFAAIMTCSHADENCPLVLGASARIALTYDDPKNFDGTPQEAAKYKERVLEIGKEILYAFSQVNA